MQSRAKLTEVFNLKKGGGMCEYKLKNVKKIEQFFCRINRQIERLGNKDVEKFQYQDAVKIEELDSMIEVMSPFFEKNQKQGVKHD